MSKLISVITATIGREELGKNILSVFNQDYEGPIEHWVVVDGQEHEPKVREILTKLDLDLDLENTRRKLRVIILPEPTKRFGGRIYSSITHISFGEYVAYLDDDNFYEPDHLRLLAQSIGENKIAYSLRKVWHKGDFAFDDISESLGSLHESVVLPEWIPEFKKIPEFFVEGKHHHIDTNCYLIESSIARIFSPYWSAEGTEGYNDRVFYLAIKNFTGEQTLSATCSRRHTLNYSANAEQLKVIENGNRIVKERYGGRLPWLGDR